MNEEKSLHQRLDDVTKAQQGLQQPQPQAQVPLDMQAERNRLWLEYVQSLNSYLRFCGVDTIPLPLRYPLLYFYHDKKCVYYIDRFPYGRLSSDVISAHTFNTFLKNCCDLPILSRQACNNLRTHLTAFVLKFPRTRIDVVIEQIKRYSPYFAALFYQYDHFCVSPEENLFFYPLVFHPYSLYDRTPRSALELASFLYDINNQTLKLYSIPHRLQKAYFSEIFRAWQKDHDAFSFRNWSAPKNSLVFDVRLPGTTSYVQYLPEADTFSSKLAPSEADYRCQLKSMRLPGDFKTTLPSASPNIIQFFRTMCGSDYALVEQMALFAAQAMDPHQGGLTVFCAPRNSEYLREALQQIFDPVTLSLKNPLSLSKITKQTHRSSLFLGQVDNKSVAFVKDTLPSDTSIKVLRKLLKGKPLPIKSTVLPNQYYYNRLHFICITDDRKKAAFLQKALKINVIDFTATETSTVDSLKPFSRADLHWLRTTLPLHGLKLRTLLSANISAPGFVVPNAEKPPSPEEELKQFLDECCSIDPQAFCDTYEVYEWFCKFYDALHPGQKPIWTKIQFNKHFRVLTEKRHIRYDRAPHHSRSQSLPWGYYGLKFSELPEPYDPCPDSSIDMLSAYLSYISTYISSHQVEFKTLLTISVTGGSSNP